MTVVQFLRRSGSALALLFLSSCTLANTVPDAVLKIVSATDVRNFTMAEASVEDGMRWGIWEEGSSDARTSYLALFADKKSIWSTQWQDAYNPALQIVPDWQWHGHAVAAVTLQFGAAAVQLSVYGLDDKKQPVKLFEKDAASIGWLISDKGQRLLALYDAKPTTLVATCYSWNESAGKLNTQPCK
ncbi:hypothetical protein [Enterobacter sp. Bisph1]|uniref:hypothetical protein n=1 Tax=Enterobacter sp. Bisph1 TaxID=1274399 RepID=UPI00057C10D2|nr:hypothetical protein [Enterobacter sp. Bisph1]